MAQATGNSGSPGKRPAFDRLGGRVFAGFILALGLVGGVGAWAFSAQLTGAVIAKGTVKVDQNIKQVQHRDGGIVAEIAVREGDSVDAGQVMFRLEDAQSRAELSILTGQRLEAEARRARLLADRDAASEIDFSARLPADDSRVAALVAAERRLHAGNLANRVNQRQQLEMNITQVEEEISALAAQKAALADELKLVEDSHGRLLKLQGKGLIEKPRTEEAARERVNLRGKLGEVDANMARSRSRISEIRMRILAVDDVARTEAQRELVVVDSRLQELADRITAVQDRLTRTDIRAPISGRINEVSVHTVGGVITPAEVLATIVPAGSRLRIEVQLPITAIDQVYLGQQARVRFSSFNHRTTPEVLGRITHVSPATTSQPANAEPYYVGHVELLDGERQRLGKLELLPGMPAEIYLSTQEQTAAAYFARPLLDQFERAFREE